MTVFGAEDRVVTARDVAELRSLAETAEVYVLRGCGHLSPLERPREVAALLSSWLMRIDSMEENRHGYAIRYG